MQTYTLTRTVHFSAAHRLYNPAWSAARNTEVYGRCARPGGHGHNYTLRVTVTGTLDEATGMVMNVTDLGALLRREVVAQLDHRNLNTDVPFLEGVVTTMENIAARLAERLAGPLAEMGVRLSALELAESERNSVRLEIGDVQSDGSD
jgi:6-pyruvoyltetrahydropterin/6-carboxytetrahydropterin synthase